MHSSASNQGHAHQASQLPVSDRERTHLELGYPSSQQKAIVGSPRAPYMMKELVNLAGVGGHSQLSQASQRPSRAYMHAGLRPPGLQAVPASMA